ncbi:MAG: dockerin type I repeat-containing protein [Phycisphaerales bacterium]
MASRPFLALTCSLPLALTSMVVAGGKTVEVGLVARVGEVPAGGDGTAIANLNSPFCNGLGEPGFTGELGSGDRFVWSGAGIVWLNSNAAGVVLTGAESTMGISDDGGFIYSPAVDGEDAVWTQAGLLLSEPQPIPGEVKVWSSFNSRPTMSPGGTAFWVTGLSASPGGATYGRGFMRCENPKDPLSAILVGSSGDAIEQGDEFYEIGTIGIGFAYGVSSNAEGTILILKMAGLPTSSDDFLYVNGELREREGDPIAPGSSDKWGLFRGVGINNAGTYVSFGPLTGGDPATNEYLAVDGAILVREGDVVDGIELTSGHAVRWASINDLGQVAHVWESASTSGTLFLTESKAGAPVTRALVSIGDALDFDGDGVGDATLTDFTTSSVIGPGIGLSDQPWAFVGVVAESAALGSFAAILRVPISGSVSPADLNGDGVVNGADLAILLGAWGGRGLADINGDGEVNGADLAILLGAWSA